MMSVFIFALALLFFLTFGYIYIANTGSRNLLSSRNSFVLGTVVLLKAFGKNGSAAIDEAMIALNSIDDKMSAFKEDSEISRINHHAGNAPQTVSPETYAVVRKASSYAKLTGGAFDPTIRPLVKLWNKGIEQEQLPDKSSITEKLPLVNYNDILFNDDQNTILLKNKGQEIDLGGIAKGFAADKVRDIFIKHGIKNALIDLGGNIYALGSKPDGALWNVGIQNPFMPRGQYLGVLKIKNRSVVTSGNYEKFFVKDGKQFHHILDPKTGYPSESKIISATILSRDSIDGDGLSTGIYILGVEKSLQLIESLENIEAILVTDDKKVFLTSGIQEFFVLTDNNFSIKREFDCYE